MDGYTGANYEHRRDWVERQLLEVASAFAIDIASYAVMSNHYHVVLRVDQDRANSWSVDDVLSRWHKLFKGTQLSQRFLKSPNAFGQAELERVRAQCEIWRARLSDVSWFMRCVNEPIARRANAEDDCTGAFWEGRFKSQALLDERAVLGAMAYVDLNPVRAGLAERPEEGEFTSIKHRVACIKAATTPVRLMPFCVAEQNPKRQAIPCRFPEYLELVEWTGFRAHRSGCRRYEDSQPNVLSRFGISETLWFRMATHFESNYRQWVGSEKQIRMASQNVGKTRSRSPPLAA
ncbi:MAG: transposase [Pseudomonadota bacterium]